MHAYREHQCAQRGYAAEHAPQIPDEGTLQTILYREDNPKRQIEQVAHQEDKKCGPGLPHGKCGVHIEEPAGIHEWINGQSRQRQHNGNCSEDPECAGNSLLRRPGIFAARGIGDNLDQPTAHAKV